MSFESLSAELQSIINFQYSQNLKIALIVLMFSASLFYNFYIKDRETKTVFMSVVMIRLAMRAISNALMYISPLFIFALAPEWNGYDFITPFFSIFVGIVLIYLIAWIWDVFRYGVPVILKHGGMDLNDADANFAYKKFQRLIKNGRG